MKISGSRTLGWKVEADSMRRCVVVQASSRLRSEMTAGYKGFKLAAGDGAGFGQLGEFSEGIGGGFGLMKGEGIQHFRFDFRIANGFNIFTREGRYDNGAVGNGVGNDTGGGEIRDGFNNGEVTVAGCGFIIDAERGCFGVREVIGRLNAQVYIVRGILFDCGAALVKDVHCGVGEAFEAFDRLGFTFQPGVGTLAGLTGGGTGIEIADDGGQVKRIGEDEGIKSQHFGYFLSFHTVFWQEIQSASMARAYSSDWPKTVRVTVAGDAGL